jgi:hypothetical protein
MARSQASEWNPRRFLRAGHKRQLPWALVSCDAVISWLFFAPEPEGRTRGLFAASVIEADLDLLASEQQSDGGWPYEPVTYMPASRLEWRGYVTVRAISLLQRIDG